MEDTYFFIPRFLKGMFAFLLRSWFFCTFTFAITLTSFATRLVSGMYFLSEQKRQGISRFLAVLGSKLIFTINPHISMKKVTVPNAIEPWNEHLIAEAGRNKTPLLLISHSSTLDSFVLFAALPLFGLRSLRVLAKSSLFELPLFGHILKACGHFPVHYMKESKTDNFSVDKEAQKQVMEHVEDYVQDGGILAVFPEGQINRKDPHVLQPFRHGSLALAGKYDMQVWGFIHVGVDTTWPTTHAIGGFSSEVQYKIFQIPDAPADAPLEAYAKHVQDIMQTELDLLLARQVLNKTM